MTSYLHAQRLCAVLREVRAAGARSILDLGCGDGALLARLAHLPGIERVVGADISHTALAAARQRLAETPPPAGVAMTLVQASMTEPNPSLTGFDAGLLIETIEHLDPGRLASLEGAVFGGLRPRMVIVTTPNADFNPLLGVPDHRLRHREHRFEWGREKLQSWAGGLSRRYGYSVRFADIPHTHPRHGGPTQMAVFTRRYTGAAEPR